MGTVVSQQRDMDLRRNRQNNYVELRQRDETVSSKLSRLDEEIVSSERTHPTARLAVVTAELDSLQQLLQSLDIYRKPMLAMENEDFIANVNRKEMRKVELSWLKRRYEELMKEKNVLHSQILRTKTLYAELQQLIENIWGTSNRPGMLIESDLSRAHALRDALAAINARLRAAAEHAHAAIKSLDHATPAWKLASVGKSGIDRTRACADACSLLVAARCQENCARRVLSAQEAPRASRTLRLILDYAFTDAFHDHKHQRATETFAGFRESLDQMINSIHQVLLNNIENLNSAEKEVEKYRKNLKSVRMSALVQAGLDDLYYEAKAVYKFKNLRYL